LRCPAVPAREFVRKFGLDAQIAIRPIEKDHVLDSVSVVFGSELDEFMVE
jgi:hypothetical protein